MNTYDPKKASQVWQRVQSQKNQETPAGREDNLAGLIMVEMESAAAYAQLARQMSAKQAAVLQSLSRETQAHASCLKGIHALISGQPPVIRTPVIPGETPWIGLRKGYGRHMRLVREYENRSEDPEYGPVFRVLAQQERDHCRRLLELIGSLQNHGNK